ncbi:MAG: hypothetical protein HOJ67_00055 [Rhodospirillaceae bacterium]|nr:hypothetical protein [Rhodospirillaceae bacterium]
MNNKTLKLGVLAIIVLWIAGMGWYQYIRVEPYKFKSGNATAEYQDQWKKCANDDRRKQYDCREALIRDKKTKTFNRGTSKFVPTFVPPLVILLIYLVILKLKQKKELAVVRERSLGRRAELRAEAEAEAAKECEERQRRQVEKKIEEDRKSSINKAVSKARVNEWGDPIVTMLVEEDAELTGEIRKNMDRELFHAVISRDLNDALIGLDSIKYNLIVMNIFTRGGNGIKAIAQIAEERPDIKIIATAADQEGMPAAAALEAAKMSGAHAVLAMPFQMFALTDAIIELIPEAAGDD